MVPSTHALLRSYAGRPRATGRLYRECKAPRKNFVLLCPSHDPLRLHEEKEAPGCKGRLEHVLFF